MTKKEIQDIISNKLGYELHHISNNTNYVYFNQFNSRCKRVDFSEDFKVQISLDVEFDESDKNDVRTTFILGYITKRGYFQFKSASYSDITRNDFVSIEIDFVIYCLALNRVEFL